MHLRFYGPTTPAALLDTTRPRLSHLSDVVASIGTNLALAVCGAQRMQREAEDADAFDPAWSDPRALRRELQGMTRIDIRSR